MTGISIRFPLFLVAISRCAVRFKVTLQGQESFRRPYEWDGPAGRPDCGFNHDRAGCGRRKFDRDGRRPSPRDWSISPDQRRCSFIPGVQCDACKLIGHEASSCDMLAIALFLNKYIKHSLSDDVRCAIELTWVDRWKALIRRQFDA